MKAGQASSLSNPASGVKRWAKTIDHNAGRSSVTNATTSRPQAPKICANEASAKKLASDHRAFVHFLDSHKVLLFDDDHVPVPPVTSWEPGKNYSYTRTKFIPIYPYVGDVDVRVGLQPVGRGEQPFPEWGPIFAEIMEGRSNYYGWENSVTKRFTSATHFFLGLALAIAPVGAWIAQTGHLDIAPIVLAAGVICWVAGFDLIYATQDYDFDRREGIRSLVVKLGITRSLRLAQLLHLLTFAALTAFGLVAKLGALYYWSLPLIAAALVYEHKTQKRDLAGINRAFFQSNAFVSAVFLLAVCVDRLT